MNQGEATGTYTATAAGVDVVAHIRCRRIRVKENFTSAAGATLDLAQAQPKGATAVVILKGNTAYYEAPGPNGAFNPGETIGQIFSSGADVVVQQIEDQGLGS